jgi:hypothetical protein
MKRTERYFFTVGLILILISSSAAGQIPNSMFFLPGVPQSNRINPAIQPGCGFYLGFPALAPLRFQVNSGSLAFNDIFIEYGDSIILPFHPQADKEAFLRKLSDVNYFQTSVGTSLGSFGFRAGSSFFSVDLTARVDGNIFYPRGFFDLIFTGAPDQGGISFSGLGADINVFNELSLGWSRKNFIIPNLDIGIRGKALFGLANLTTKESSFEIETSYDAWSLGTQLQLNASAPTFVTFSEDIENGEPFIFDDAFFDSASPMEIASSVLSLNRFGMAVDIGANYRILPQLLLSASLLDIGGIRWNNTIEGAIDFEYEFNGIEVNPFTGIDTTLLDDITDSLLNSYSITVGQPYFSALNTKLFIGASYYPIEKIGFGFLSRTDFLNQRISQQFTGTVNMTTGKFANLSLSYSYMAKRFNNIGAGLSFNVGPLNMYLISDNIISGALKPISARSVNLWFGMNLTFGWKRAEKKEKKIDQPLVI